MVDFPFPVAITCTSGKCESYYATANGVLPGMTSEGDTASIEIQQIKVVDEDGDDVFRMGILVP